MYMLMYTSGHYNLPNPLTEYLYHGHPHVIRDLSTLSISLGPYESYYAHDKTSASWSNLPPALEKAVLGRLVSQDAWKTVWKENGRDAPSFVSLGADGSYFMRAVGGGGSWELKSKEDGMVGTNKFLNDSKDFTGVAVSLFHSDILLMLISARGSTSSRTIQIHMSCFSPPEKPSPISPSTHGPTTTKWLRRYLPSSKLCHLFHARRNRVNKRQLLYPSPIPSSSRSSAFKRDVVRREWWSHHITAACRRRKSAHPLASHLHSYRKCRHISTRKIMERRTRLL